jgi:hypothetical protein
MRALTKDGRKAFREWVLGLREDVVADIPLQLLENDTCSYEIIGSTPLEPKIFVNKYELAECLFPKVKQLEELRVDHDGWPGIWDAFSLFYFESVCPKKNSFWQRHSVSYYVYGANTGNKPKYYEHRIYGPVTLYRTSPEGVRPFFGSSPGVLGQYEMSIGASNELAENSTILAVINKLYARDDGSVVSGYTSTRTYKGFSKKLDAPGGIRRIPKVFQQLRRTYDLAGISEAALFDLLPKEFEPFRGRC